jgi:capsular polysaccharide biosynthesis protein
MVDRREYLKSLRAPWRLIALAALLGVLIALGASILSTTTYRSTATLFVSVDDANASVASAYTGELFALQRVRSYAEIVTSNQVTQDVVEELGLPMSPAAVADKLSVNNPPDTVILEISATDPDPATAQQIAQTAAEKFAAYANELETPTAATQVGPSTLVRVDLVKSASLPTTPYSPRTALNVAIGLLIGLVVGAAAAATMAIRSRRRTPAAATPE